MRDVPTADLLATIEVAKRLGLERSTLSRWVKEGRITPAMRLPGATGAFLFHPSEVERVRLAENLAAAEPTEAEAS
jgi:excisionase family DNA binding protein